MKEFKSLALILLLIVGVVISLHAQQSGVGFLPKKIYNQHDIHPFSPDVKLSMDTGFGGLLPGTGYFSSSINAETGTMVSSRLRVSVGMGLNSLFLSDRGSNGMLLYCSGGNFGSLYVEGEYAINKNYSIIALGYKTINLQHGLSKVEKLNPHALDLSSEGVMLNLNYHVNVSFQINASFSYEKGFYSPYYNVGGMNGGFVNVLPGSFGR